jgi:hypothetical protein
MPLVQPKENKGRAVLRALVESGVGMVPVVGPLTRLFQTTHPSKFQTEVEQWQGDITASVNDHEGRLAALEAAYEPHLLLSNLAIDVALWIVEEDEPSPGYPVDMDRVRAAFPSAEPDLVDEAIHELADAGLVTITPVISAGGARVKANWPLFWLFQPLATGVSPMKDAADLAQWCLSEEYLSSQEVEQRYGWTVRRVNAAMELIATFSPEGLVSRPAHPVFTIWGIHIDASMRRRLRRFLGADP